jgi:hypothetical protein
VTARLQHQRHKVVPLTSVLHRLWDDAIDRRRVGGQLTAVCTAWKPVLDHEGIGIARRERKKKREVVEVNDEGGQIVDVFSANLRRLEECPHDEACAGLPTAVRSGQHIVSSTAFSSQTVVLRPAR